MGEGKVRAKGLQPPSTCRAPGQGPVGGSWGLVWALPSQEWVLGRGGMQAPVPEKARDLGGLQDKAAARNDCPDLTFTRTLRAPSEKRPSCPLRPNCKAALYPRNSEGDASYYHPHFTDAETEARGTLAEVTKLGAWRAGTATQARPTPRPGLPLLHQAEPDTSSWPGMCCPWWGPPSPACAARLTPN